MIKGSQTNTVYLSSKLLSDQRFSESCNKLIGILKKHKINFKFLQSTKDIWCRDYMPIQLARDQFIQFRYEPSYLKDDLSLQSNPRLVCQSNNIPATFSKINLDGGNLVNWSNKAIVTDRIFDENSEFTSKRQLISELEELLQVEVIVIPQIKSDLTGHADGLVRFVNENTLIGNNRDQEFKYWSKKLNKVLQENGLDYIDIPSLEHKENKYPDHAIGCYINYLEVQDLIVLPIFETENNRDIEVFHKFQQIFPNRKIEAINYNSVGLFGGLLNCTTWTIAE